MVDYYQGNNPFLNLNLMFLIMIKHSSFYDVLANKIPNQILTEDEFAILFAGELDNYVASYYYIILMVVLKKRSVSKKKNGKFTITNFQHPSTGPSCSL